MRFALPQPLRAWFGRTVRSETPIDQRVPPEINIGIQLTRLKLEQGKALAANEPERAQRIHAQRVALWEELQNLQESAR